MRDVPLTFISHEQTQSNRVCCVQPLDVLVPKDLFSILLDGFDKIKVMHEVC